MIIGKPKIEEKNGYLELSSQIKVESDNSLSTTIWYRFPLSQKEFVSDRSDSFLVGLLLLAMVLEEDITVEGKISPRLAYNLKQVQEYFHTWFPDTLHLIQVDYQNVEEDKGEKHDIVSSFSGGIDAFYTLLKHTAEIPDRDRITHALFIGGFDVPVDDPDIPSVKDHYANLLKDVKVKLLTADTNLKEYLDPQISQATTFGAVLSSIFLALGKNIDRVYLPSAYQYHDMLPCPEATAVADGSNPITDHLFSTETTMIFHYDPAVSRMEKTIFIAKHLLTYDNLRVCWAPVGLKNCCLCSKCFRTMLELKLCNSLDKYRLSFPRPFTKKIWLAACKDLGFIREIRNHALDTGHWVTAFQMQYIIIKPVVDKYNLLNLWLMSGLYFMSHKLKERFPLYKSLVKSIKKTLGMDYQDYLEEKK